MNLSDFLLTIIAVAFIYNALSSIASAIEELDERLAEIRESLDCIAAAFEETCLDQDHEAIDALEPQKEP